MSCALLSLGSNIPPCQDYLALARTVFGEKILAQSSLYRTAPWGGVDQEDFLNQSLLVEDPEGQPQEWLRYAQDAESRAHRIRDERWGPRTLDVDIIECWDSSDPQQWSSQTRWHSDDPELLLPHPRAIQRAFVLIPSVELLRVYAPQAPILADYEDALNSLPPSQKKGVCRVETRPTRC